MTYLQSVVNYGAPTTNPAYAQGLVNHWSALVLYVKNETKTWPAGVLMGDSVPGLVPDGGAKVLFANGSMQTFDGQAGLQLSSPIPAGGPFLFTFLQVPTSQCDAGTSLRLNGRCYEVSDYPDGGTYDPPATISLCLHTKVGPDSIAIGPAGIGHARSSFGTEVLPDTTSSFLSCRHDSETEFVSWLRREAGPLGRMLATAYDYLAPRELIADDAGESGSIESFSLVGGILNEIFKDDFEEINTPPDIGDAWTVDTTSPGYIRINQTGLGDLPGPIVELSQGQGACTNCPIFRLLGTRANSTQADSVALTTSPGSLCRRSRV
jgi:hypothetical protein